MNFRSKTFFITILLFLGVIPNVFANPQGANVVSGSATFTSTPNTLTINTATNKTIINYNSFSIAANEATIISQPSASSSVLNRVVGVDPSEIYGTLSSNGEIFLVNPNGIIFGPGSQVNAPAILASTLNITNNDFLNGDYSFFQERRKGSSFIINQGRLAASPGGYIALLSQAVNNQGVIIAPLGSVALAAGDKLTLALDSQSQISVAIDDAVQSEVFGSNGQPINSAIQNSGTIKANGGTVLLTAKVLNDVFDNAVNNSGVVEAGSMQAHDGVVDFVASGAPVINSGKIKATQINMSDSNSSTGIYSTGSLITPNTLTLSSDGDIYSLGVLESSSLIENGYTFQVGGIFNPGNADVKNADNAIVYAANTNVSGTITDPSNIIVDPDVTLTMIANTTFNAGSAFIMDPTATINGGGYDLSISAGSDSILGNINNVNLFTLSSNSTSNVIFTSSASSTFQVNTVKTNYLSALSRDVIDSNGNQEIFSDSDEPGGLEYIQDAANNPNGLSGNYILENNIDASETSSWNSGAGFVPIGNSWAFSGNFNGNNNTISNLLINLPSMDVVGLFGYLTGTISNLGLTNVDITGSSYVSGLVGVNYGGITNSSVTGIINGSGETGGLVGENQGTISNSSSFANVNGGTSAEIGGVAGDNYGSITNSYNAGNVDGSYYVGGLAGYNAGSINASYNTGTITAGSYIGGLAGDNGNTILNSYNTGSVNGGGETGGLVGENDATISNSYNSADVNGGAGSEIGGVAGANFGFISNSYSTGNVISSGTYLGGLTGYSDGTIANSYFTDNAYGSQGGGTYESGGAAAFYSPLNPVYAIGTAGQWDIFTPVWDTYSNALPLLGWQASGTPNAIWNGNTSTTWSTASNWSTNAVPVNSTNIFIFNLGNDPVLNTAAYGNNITIASNATFDLNGQALTAGGTFTNNGTLKLVGNETLSIGTFTDNGTTDYYGSGSYTITPLGTYNNLQFDNGTFMLGGTFTANGNFIIDANVTLDMTADTNLTAGNTFTMDPTASISGIEDNLSISAGSNSTLGNIYNINLFTLSSNSGSNVTFISNSDSVFQVNTVQTNYLSIFSRSVGTGTSSDPIMIYSDSNAPGGLQYINTSGLGLYYELANSIDASETTSWNSGTGFIPIGNASTPFTGSFEGVYYTISNLTINTASDYAGLFGYASNSAVLSDIQVINENVTGGNYVGGVVGYNEGSISTSYTSGSVTGASNVGGLAGYNNGTISNTYSNVNVSSLGDYAGGLAGYNDTSGDITNSYSTGNVSGNDYVGGFVGKNDGTIANSFATIGNVTGSGMNVGGLVGDNGTILNSFFSAVQYANQVGKGIYQTGSEIVQDAYEILNTAAKTPSEWIPEAETSTGLPGLLIAIATATINNIFVWTGNSTDLHNWNDPANWLNGVPPPLDPIEIILIDAPKVANNYPILPAPSNQYPSSYPYYQPLSLDVAQPNATFDSSIYNISGGLLTNVGTLMVGGSTFASNYGFGLFIGTSGSTINYIGLTNGSQTIANNIPYYNLTISGGNEMISGTIDANGTITIDPNVSLNLTANTSLVAAGYNGQGGVFTMASNATINAGSFNLSISAVNSSTPSTLGIINNVDLLTVENSGSNPNVTFQLGGALNVTSLTNSLPLPSVTISTLDLNGQSLTVTGTFTNNGTLELIGSETPSIGTFTDNGTTDYYGNPFTPNLTYAITPLGTYDNLQFNNGTFTLNNALTVKNNLNIQSGTLNANGSNISVGGNWDNSGGTFNAGTGTVFLTGSGSITSGGSSFSNLTINASRIYTVMDGITTTGNFTQTSGIFIANPTNTTFSVGGSFSLTGGQFNRFTGLGTAASPYLIYDVYGLQGMLGYLSSDFELNNSITGTNGASSTSNWNAGAGFVPIGGNSSTQPTSISLPSIPSFTGSFNGEGYSISNITINTPNTYYVGLFGYTSSAAQLSNIQLTSVSVTGGGLVGGLVGLNLGSITNSSTSGSVNGSLNNEIGYAGGLVGLDYFGSISNSSSAASVNGNSEVGGLAGFSDGGSISNSNSTGAVSGNSFDVGGLVGQNYEGGSITDSYSTGEVSSSSYEVGGLVGINKGSISDSSYSKSNVIVNGGSGSYDVGGLVGLNDGTISNSSYSVGTVSGDSGSNDLGGLVGYNETEGTIDNSNSSGVVSGSGYAGGFVGFNDGSIDGSSSSGNVSGSGYAGGFVGYNDIAGTINNSNSSGTVSGLDAGGFVGYNAGSIGSSSSTANSVSGSGYAGGFAGFNDTGGTIDNSNSSGVVSGYDAGGFVGYNAGSIGSSSSTASSVSGSGYAGGFAGFNNDGSILNCAWDVIAVPLIGYDVYTSSPIPTFESSTNPDVTGTDNYVYL